MTTCALTETTVLETLRQVIDPELGCNIVDLGLIYSVNIVGSTVKLTMTVTTPGCPMQDTLRGGVQAALLNLDAVADVQVEMVYDPPWHPSMMTDAGRKMIGARFS
jgi:metal-sulfur cluster biosynthetic enzyme